MPIIPLRSMNALSIASLMTALGCATTKVEDLSADEHEAAAQHENSEARAAADRYDPKAIRHVTQYPSPTPGCDQSLPGDCSPGWTLSKNATDRELALASAHLARAKKHQAAAKALRDAEVRACGAVVPADRELSPFFRGADIKRVEDLGRSDGATPLGSSAGATVIFTSVPGLTAQRLQQILDCHLAVNAALNFDQTGMAECPLNVRGVSARARAVSNGFAVDVTSTDPGAALEIVRRAMTLAPASQRATSMR
jgi:hypothetical protein